MISPGLCAVVTPVCDDYEAAGQFLREVATATGLQTFAVVVDDGSMEPLTPSIVLAAGLGGVVIRLKRNIGHQGAIAIGLAYVAENLPDAICVVADSDGEDLPEKIETLLAALLAPDVDVAVAKRRARMESPAFRFFYGVYRGLLYMGGRSLSFGNFMAIKPQAVARLVAMRELWMHLAAAVLVSKLRIAYCPIARGRRYTGRSKMNFVGLVLHGLRAFSVVAQEILLRLGIACLLLGVLGLAGSAVLWGLHHTGASLPFALAAGIGLSAIFLLQTAALTFIALLLSEIPRREPVKYQEFIDRVLVASGD